MNKGLCKHLTVQTTSKMSDGGEFFTGTVAPIAGVIITELLHFGPMYAVICARKQGRLGSLDPVLFANTTPQAVVWTIYGIFCNNIYYIIGSIGGILMGTFYLLSALQLGVTKTQMRRIEIILLTQLTLIITFSTVGWWHREVAKQATGVLSMLASCFSYSTPFLNLRLMIKARDASSINKGFLFMQIVSGVMWTSYSLFDFDIYVIIPSVISLAFGIIQATLVVIFWKPASKTEEVDNKSSSLLDNVRGCYQAPNCFRPCKSRGQQNSCNASQAMSNNMEATRFTSFPADSSQSDVILDISGSTCMEQHAKNEVPAIGYCVKGLDPLLSDPAESSTPSTSSLESTSPIGTTSSIELNPIESSSNLVADTSSFPLQSQTSFDAEPQTSFATPPPGVLEPVDPIFQAIYPIVASDQQQNLNNEGTSSTNLGKSDIHASNTLSSI